MHSILHILNTSTELMSAVELMSGAKSRKWVHQKPTNQPPSSDGIILFRGSVKSQHRYRKYWKITNMEGNVKLK